MAKRVTKGFGYYKLAQELTGYKYPVRHYLSSIGPKDSSWAQWVRRNIRFNVKRKLDFGPSPVAKRPSLSIAYTRMPYARRRAVSRRPRRKGRARSKSVGRRRKTMYKRRTAAAGAANSHVRMAKGNSTKTRWKALKMRPTRPINAIPESKRVMLPMVTYTGHKEQTSTGTAGPPKTYGVMTLLGFGAANPVYEMSVLAPIYGGGTVGTQPFMRDWMFDRYERVLVLGIKYKLTYYLAYGQEYVTAQAFERDPAGGTNAKMDQSALNFQPPFQTTAAKREWSLISGAGEAGNTSGKVPKVLLQGYIPWNAQASKGGATVATATGITLGERLADQTYQSTATVEGANALGYTAFALGHCPAIQGDVTVGATKPYITFSIEMSYDCLFIDRKAITSG